MCRATNNIKRSNRNGALVFWFVITFRLDTQGLALSHWALLYTRSDAQRALETHYKIEDEAIQYLVK